MQDFTRSLDVFLDCTSEGHNKMNRANVETKTTIYILYIYTVYIIKYDHVLFACLKGRPVYIDSVVVLPSFRGQRHHSR